MNKNSRRTGFTLIELLAVIAIISAVIAIILPCVGKVRAMARNQVCQSNVNQIYLAYCEYVTNQGKSFSRHAIATNIVVEEDDIEAIEMPVGVWRCPEDRSDDVSSYWVYRFMLDNLSLKSYDARAERLILEGRRPRGVTESAGRHDGYANVLYLDKNKVETHLFALMP